MNSSTVLKFPAKSHRKTIILPSESSELAEFMGIIFGDGGINNDWQLVITLNSVSDEEYSKYIRNRIAKLFGLNAVVRKRPNMNALVLVCSSMNLVDFLLEKGAVKGNKVRQQIDIPIWIKGNSELERSFIRGLVDTDGCLFIHNKKASRHIGFCFTSGSLKLITSVAEALKKNSIKPHIADKQKRIYLYSHKAVELYLKIFGSSNPRILNKYQVWRGVRVV